MIYGGQFHDADENSDGTNNAMWSHSASNSSADNGLWYYPDGTQVPLYNQTNKQVPLII